MRGQAVGSIQSLPERDYFSSHPSERNLVKPFLSCFDVTKSLRFSNAGGEIAVYFLKPEGFIAELVGLERELLMVYAPFSDFQARTVQLHDEILNRYRGRLDPLGSIIVTDAQDTSSRLEEFLLKEPERAPIIPLSSDDARRLTDANSIRALFIEHFFRRDLFALESALRTDTLFFDRGQLITELVDRFRSGQNSGLFGLRRIGKTSVLYAVGRRIEDGKLGGVAYLDVSGHDMYGARWWELLQMLVVSFTEPLNLQRADRSKIRALNITYQESDAAKHFRADIDRMRIHFPGARLLLCLDEIEYLTFDISPASHWRDDFLPLWQTLRSVHQGFRGDLCYIVAGVNPHILEAARIGNFDNPLFATVKSYFVKPFELTTVREMVRRIARWMGLRCDEALYSRLTAEYGGHPFLIRQACSHLAKLVKSRPGRLPIELFERERPHIALALEKNIKQILNVLRIWYPNEFELFKDLARGNEAEFREFARLSSEFTEHMTGYGLVDDPRSDHPTITIELVKNYLAREDSSAISPPMTTRDNEEILAEISRRRNAVEPALRNTLRDGLRFAAGRKAGDLALQSLSPKRRVVLSEHSYEDLWNHLFFSEYGNVIDSNWQAFENFFSEDKRTVLQWLNHINRCRADAHARSLGEEDLAYLWVCFRRLDDSLGI